MSSGQGNIQQPMDDEIDFLELWRTIWSRRKLIAGVTFGVSILTASVTLLMPNIYRAEVLMVAANKPDGASKAGSLMSQFGGLASLAGISIGSSSSEEENLAVLSSRTFLWEYIQNNRLMPILFEDGWDSTNQKWKQNDIEKQPSLWDAYRLFSEKILSVNKNKKNNLITLSIEWSDAQLSANWANNLAERLNEYLRQQAILRSQANLEYLYVALNKTQVQEVRQSLFDMIAQEQKNIMFASTQKEYAFKILDAAFVPDKKVRPKRTIIVIMATLMSLILSISWVIFRQKRK